MPSCHCCGTSSGWRCAWCTRDDYAGFAGCSKNWRCWWPFLGTGGDRS